MLRVDRPRLLRALPLAAAFACVDVPADVDAIDFDVDAVVDDDHAYDRALARLRDIEAGTPRVERGYVWWSERGAFGQRVEKRRLPVSGAPVEVVVDEACDVDAAPVDVDVGSVSAAPDGRRVAFSADVDRADRYGVFVKDTQRGTVKQVADDADFSVAWSKSGDLFFTRFGDDERPRSLWRVVGGEASPELVHESPSEELLVADVDTDDSAVFFGASPRAFAGDGTVRTLPLSIGRVPSAVR